MSDRIDYIAKPIRAVAGAAAIEWRP